MTFWPYVMTCVRRCRSFVVRPSQSEAVVYLENGLPRIAKFYTNVHTGRVYKHTGYDVTIYFRLAVMEVLKKTVENAVSYGFRLNLSRMV